MKAWMQFFCSQVALNSINPVSYTHLICCSIVAAPLAAKCYRVKADALRVRSATDIKSAVVAVLKRNMTIEIAQPIKQEISIQGMTGTWQNIDIPFYHGLQKPLKGYIFDHFLEDIEKPITSVAAEFVGTWAYQDPQEGSRGHLGITISADSIIMNDARYKVVNFSAENDKILVLLAPDGCTNLIKELKGKKTRNGITLNLEPFESDFDYRKKNRNIEFRKAQP